MAQNEPQRKETPPGPSPNSPSLLFEYQCRGGKFIRLANRIKSKKIDSVAIIESIRIETFFCPNWNALVSGHPGHPLDPPLRLHRSQRSTMIQQVSKVAADRQQFATAALTHTLHGLTQCVTCHPAEPTFPPLPHTRSSDPGGMRG